MDVALLELTRQRMVKDQTLLPKTITTVREFAAAAKRRDNPLAADIDLQLRKALANLGTMDDMAERLIAAEHAVKRFGELVASNDKRIADENAAHFQRNLDEQRRRIQEGNRAAWSLRAGSGTRTALCTLADRVSYLQGALGAIAHDGDLQRVLLDFNLALDSAAASVALELRESHNRAKAAQLVEKAA